MYIHIASHHPHRHRHRQQDQVSATVRHQHLWCVGIDFEQTISHELTAFGLVWLWLCNLEFLVQSSSFVRFTHSFLAWLCLCNCKLGKVDILDHHRQQLWRRGQEKKSADFCCQKTYLGTLMPIRIDFQKHNGLGWRDGMDGWWGKIGLRNTKRKESNPGQS